MSDEELEAFLKRYPLDWHWPKPGELPAQMHKEAFYAERLSLVFRELLLRRQAMRELKRVAQVLPEPTHPEQPVTLNELQLAVHESTIALDREGFPR